MRMVEEYRDSHKGKIWIIGSGRSLDDFPQMFFKDKITIAMNYTGLAFPKCPDFPTYSVHIHEEALQDMLKWKPGFLKRCILAWLPPDRTEGLTWPEDYNQDPVWIRWHAWVLKKEDIENTVAQMMDKERRKDCVHLSFYTTLHVAIEVAVILGAENVTLAGADPYQTAEQSHALRIKNPNGEPIYRQRKIGPSKNMECWRKGNLWLAQAFKPYGIQVRRFYYPDGYEEIE